MRECECGCLSTSNKNWLADAGYRCCVVFAWVRCWEAWSDKLAIPQRITWSCGPMRHLSSWTRWSCGTVSTARHWCGSQPHSPRIQSPTRLHRRHFTPCPSTYTWPLPHLMALTTTRLSLIHSLHTWTPATMLFYQSFRWRISPVERVFDSALSRFGCCCCCCRACLGLSSQALLLLHVYNDGCHDNRKSRPGSLHPRCVRRVGATMILETRDRWALHAPHSTHYGTHPLHEACQSRDSMKTSRSIMKGEQELWWDDAMAVIVRSLEERGMLNDTVIM